MKPKKIVSLIASATEILCALGCKKQLVGRSHECDFPPSVGLLPACTEPRLEVQETNAEIDPQVKNLLEQALSVYWVNTVQLKTLRPDLIVTQSQCEVCAVSLNDLEQALEDWLGARPRLLALQTNRLADLWSDITRLAEVLEMPERGRELVAGLRGRVQHVQDVSRRITSRPRVAFIEWIDPLMAGGNWMPELIEMAGGIDVLGTAGEHAPRISWETLCQADPEVVVIAPCGFSIERICSEMQHLTSKDEWDRLQATRAGRVYLADGNQYFNRPGPRLAESLEILAEMLHPRVFNFGHCGNGWLPCPPASR